MISRHHGAALYAAHAINEAAAYAIFIMRHMPCASHIFHTPLFEHTLAAAAAIMPTYSAIAKRRATLLLYYYAITPLRHTPAASPPAAITCFHYYADIVTRA